MIYFTRFGDVMKKYDYNNLPSDAHVFHLWEVMSFLEVQPQWLSVQETAPCLVLWHLQSQAKQWKPALPKA